MKKLKYVGAVVLAAAIGTGIYAFGSGEEAPQKVKEAFARKFPTVKKVKWENESNSEWEGEFRMKGTGYSANFQEDGTWLETEHGIKKKSVPATVKMTLDTEFSDYKIEEAELSETIEGSVYEFELETGEEEIAVVIDTDGKVISKKK